MDTTIRNGNTVRFGLYTVDVGERLLFKRGVPIRLQEKPFQILALLLERAGEIVSREDLHAQLWPADTFVRFDDGLNTAMKKLRIALDDSSDNPVFIETIPRRGYRFLISVEWGEETDTGIEKSRIQSRVDDPPEAAPVPAGTSTARVSQRWIWIALAIFGLAVAGLSLQLAMKSTMRSASALRPQTHSFNPQAYAEYLQADHFWKERTASGLARAVEHLKRAIAWEPDYAEAYAQLADCYVVMPMISSVPKEFAHTQARQAAERAIALDNSSAEAHLATAEIRLYDDWNFREAEREFKRALELNPKYALAYQWYAEYLSLMSRHGEAIARIQTAQQLDPTSMIVYHQAGQILQSARRYDEALQQYQKALQIQPDFAPTYSAISILYRRERNYPANLEAQREAVRYWEPESSAAAGLKAIADAYSSSGERGFLRATVEFEKKHQGRLYHRAWNYALLGDREQALYSLQKSFEAREIDILGIRNDPEFDSIRSDARFQAIVQRIGFPT